MCFYCSFMTSRRYIFYVASVSNQYLSPWRSRNCTKTTGLVCLGALWGSWQNWIILIDIMKSTCCTNKRETVFRSRHISLPVVKPKLQYIMQPFLEDENWWNCVISSCSECCTLVSYLFQPAASLGAAQAWKVEAETRDFTKGSWLSVMLVVHCIPDAERKWWLKCFLQWW